MHYVFQFILKKKDIRFGETVEFYFLCSHGAEMAMSHSKIDRHPKPTFKFVF